MAKKRKPRSKREGTVSRDDISPETLRSIWRGIERNDWMSFLQRNHPDNKWSWTNDGIQGCCPFHDEKTPSFKINFIRQQAKCFGCGAYYWNPVAFYAKVSDPPIPYTAALLEVKTNYNPSGLPHRVIKYLTKLDRHRRMKNILYHVTNTELIDAVALSASDLDYQYAAPAVQYLAKRGLPLVYHALPIGVMPQLLRLEERMTEYCQAEDEDVSLVEDMREYFKPFTKDTTWVGAVIFFYGGSPEQVSRLKLRQIPPKEDANVFAQQTTKDKLTVFVPDDMEHELGVFGLYGVPSYQTKLASKYAKIFHFVEGEFDALAIIANQIENVRFDFMVFAGGGGAHSGVDLLHNYGFEECYVVADDDEPGEHIVQTILQKTRRIACRIFMWPDALKSTDTNKPDTDPDQAVQQHGFEVVEKALKDSNNFKMPHKWATERADAEMSSVPKDDVRKLTTIAAEWGLYVTNAAERHKYVADIAERYEMPPGPVWNEILTDDDSDIAFIQRITDTLVRRFIILSTEFENGRWVYRCWHKSSRRIIDLTIGEPKLLRGAIESAEGKDLLKFILDDVGEPGFEKTRFEDEEDPAYLERLRKYVEYLVPAVSNLGRHAPSPGEVRYVNTGCHAFKPTPETPDEQFKLYLVNGTQLFKGVYPTERGDKCVWRECPGPTDGNIFMLANKQFLPRVIHPQYVDEDSLNKPPKRSVKEMFEKVHGIINAGWGFKNQETTVNLLTALVLLIPISDAVDRQPMIMFTGDQSSGKTSFVGGLIGRDALSRINLVQNSLFMANFTQAGVRQSMNYSSVCLCLDEFEDKGGNDRVSGRVRDVLQLIRGLANDTAVTRYGSASGKAQVTKLRFPVCTAGIYGLKDPADLSRFILIEMDRNLTRSNPETAILDFFGEDLLIELRNELPRLMYHAAYQVFQAHEEIKHEFRHGGKLPTEVNLTRTREMFYGLMAIMKVAGRDYRKFIVKYFKDFRIVLERLSRVSVSNDLFDEIFYTPAIPIPSTTGVGGVDQMNVNRILKEGKGELMNAKNWGVYYDEEREWLLVHWPTASPCILGRSQQFQGATPGYLKSQAQRSQYHASDDVIFGSKILQEDKWKQLLGDTQILHISVYKVRAFVKDSRLVNQAEVAPIKGREVISLADTPQWKERIAKKNWPKPPPIATKKKDETGTSKSKEATTDSSAPDSGNDSGGVDDDFDY